MRGRGRVVAELINLFKTLLRDFSLSHIYITCDIVPILHAYLYFFTRT